MRLPQWLHEELAAEAHHRNVSLNQLCFEAIVARRALLKKPPVQSTLQKLDRKRTQNRKVIEKALTQTVSQLAKDAPGRKPPDEKDRPVLEAVKKAGRPVTVSDLAPALGMPHSEVEVSLMRLRLYRWLSWRPGNYYVVATGPDALGIGFG